MIYLLFVSYTVVHGKCGFVAKSLFLPPKHYTICNKKVKQAWNGSQIIFLIVNDGVIYPIIQCLNLAAAYIYRKSIFYSIQKWK